MHQKKRTAIFPKGTAVLNSPEALTPREIPHTMPPKYECCCQGIGVREARRSKEGVWRLGSKRGREREAEVGGWLDIKQEEEWRKSRGKQAEKKGKDGPKR